MDQRFNSKPYCKPKIADKNSKTHIITVSSRKTIVCDSNKFDDNLYSLSPKLYVNEKV
jgi:hypothetical protein